ncbi:MAG: TIGR00645 family protein [Nevskia sp.]|nr:TIGR00645 family protein [Nevskia sp.]
MSPERQLERIVLGSRWLLVPLYIALSVLLAAFGIRAAVEVVHIFADLFTASEAELVLASLSLIDLVLVGNLVVMVSLSGYETFVSPLDRVSGLDRPSWLGKYDPGTIKLKVAVSLVAISAIHLLHEYLSAEELDTTRLLTLTAVHLAFVVSALILALVDKIAFAAHRQDPH